MSLVSYHSDSGLGIIHMADGRGNRLNGESLAALSSALEKGIADESARVLLIRSGEESFCLGMDLELLQQSLSTKEGSAAERAAASGEDAAATNPAVPGPAAGGSAGERSSGVDLYSRILQRIYSAPKPVIALLEGDVKAGGVGLVAACDLVIASADASFELSELLFGLVPFNVLPYVFGLRMSPQRFRYLVLSAEKIDAHSAQAWGLVDRVFAADELEKGIRSILKTMMRCEPAASARAKQFFAEALDTDFSQRRSMAASALTELMASPAVLQGLESLSSGDMPAWFGRFKPAGRVCGRGGE